jgi:hypothetical protein
MVDRGEYLDRLIRRKTRESESREDEGVGTIRVSDGKWRDTVRSVRAEKTKRVLADPRPLEGVNAREEKGRWGWIATAN